MREMSGTMIVIIKIEKNLCIFCEGKKKGTKDRATNTENLISIVINEMIPY
jgi:hypothetical protein